MDEWRWVSEGRNRQVDKWKGGKEQRKGRKREGEKINENKEGRHKRRKKLR